MPYFEDLEIPHLLTKSLSKMNITSPTPIQEKAIPEGLAGHDVFASAQTGTGKTIAYLLPVITRLLNSATDTALILAPTRELAIQVKDTIEKLLNIPVSSNQSTIKRGNHRGRDFSRWDRENREFSGTRHRIKKENEQQTPYPIALLIGGDPMRKQLDILKKAPRFIVGTPGRLVDHLSRGSLKFTNTRFLVIDEADRLLDMGFSEDLEEIVQSLPKDRQTFMFSATMPPNIIRLSEKYLINPQRIALGSTTQPTAQVNQKTIQTSVSDKFSRLLKELETREGSIIVFVKTKIGAENLADKLKRENLNAAAIHGDLRQRQREQVIHAFRSQKRRILVATDIAARGLDIPHVKHVVNYDLPQCPEDYIHRIGRTGRAGMEGHAISLISPEDNRKWRMIHAFMNPHERSSGSSSKPFKPFERSYRKPTGKNSFARFKGASSNNNQPSPGKNLGKANRRPSSKRNTRDENR